MADEKFEKVTNTKANKDASVKPDPETLDTTDPQEHMKGPISSLMHKVEDKAKDNERKDAEEQLDKNNS